MNTLAVLPALFLALQSTFPSGIDLNVPDIKRAKAISAVALDEAGVFHYRYSLSNPSESTGAIAGFRFDITTDSAVDVGRPLPRTGTWCIATPSVPVLPIGGYSASQWLSCVGRRGTFGVGVIDDDAVIRPGQTASNLVEVTSYAPPGIIQARLAPAWSPNLFPGDQGYDKIPDTVTPLELRTNIIGPIAPSAYGVTVQNPFLGDTSGPPGTTAFIRFLNPTTTYTNFPSTTDPITFTVVVLYGPTIKPETFRAHLDNKKLTSQFHPCPSCVDVVPITFDGRGGTHVLHLKIKGVTSAGKTVPKNDHLKFRVGTGGTECDDRNDED